MDIDPELLKSLREQVEAQVRTEQQIRRQADETAWLRRAEQNRAGMLADIVERYADLGERVTGLVNVTMNQQVSLSGVVESLDEIRLELEEVKRLIWILVGALAPKRGLDKFLEQAEGISQQLGSRQKLRRIRELLAGGFSEDELRGFCYDEADFRPVYDRLSEAAGKTELAASIVEYAEQKELLDLVLRWVAEKNPAKFERYTEIMRDL